LTKYWGKRDKELILPNNGSVSMALDKFYTQTTVEFDSKYKQDEFILNGKTLLEGEEYSEVKGHLDLVRSMAKIKENAKVKELKLFPNDNAFFMELMTGGVDAVMFDKPVLQNGSVFSLRTCS